MTGKKLTFFLHFDRSDGTISCCHCQGVSSEMTFVPIIGKAFMRARSCREVVAACENLRFMCQEMAPFAATMCRHASNNQVTVHDSSMLCLLCFKRWFCSPPSHGFLFFLKQFQIQQEGSIHAMSNPETLIRRRSRGSVNQKLRYDAPVDWADSIQVPFFQEWHPNGHYGSKHLNGTMPQRSQEFYVW